MPPQEKRKKGLSYLFFAIVAISISSFLYLNVCADHSLSLTQYVEEITYNGFNVENFALPDLQFFEIGIQRIMDLILARV